MSPDRAQWLLRVASHATLGVGLEVGVAGWRAQQAPRAATVATASVRVGDRDHELLVKTYGAATDCFTPGYLPGRQGELQRVFLTRSAVPSLASPPRWYVGWSETEIRRHAESCQGLVTLAQSAIGWPLRSFRGERVYRGMVDPGVVGWLSPSSAIGSPGYVRIGSLDIPVRPIWTGLLLDVLLVMSAGALALSLRDVWCRRRRLRAGECPRCRYDLLGLPGGARCPECGAVQGRLGGTDQVGTVDG